jgi:hypothetical protein
MLGGEGGSALVEFVFIALVVFVPLIYVLAGFSAVQRGVFASAAAAREAIGTAPDAATGLAPATWPAQLALEDQSVAATDVRVAYVAAGARSSSNATATSPEPGPVRVRVLVLDVITEYTERSLNQMLPPIGEARVDRP